MLEFFYPPMLLSLFKWCLVVATVLLAGQMELGNATVGARFKDWVTSVIERGKSQLSDSKVVQKSLASPPLAELSQKVGSLWNEIPKAPEPARVVEKPKPVIARKVQSQTEDESISAADRESLLKVLQ